MVRLFFEERIMKAKAVHLKNTLPAVCAAVTGQKGIKLVWEGPPRTDGKTIYSNPLPAQADEDTVKMVVGKIDHECSHILYSDFGLFREKARDALTMGVWNAVEDTMAERRLAEDFLGCRQTLAEANKIAVKKGKTRTGEQGPSDALMTFVRAWGAYHVTGQEVVPIVESSRAALVGLLEESGVQRLEALLATKLYSVASTAETYSLASQVLQLVKDIEQEQQEQESGDDSDGEDGQTDDADDSSNANSEQPDDGQTDNANGQNQGDNQTQGDDGSDGEDGQADDTDDRGNADSEQQDDGQTDNVNGQNQGDDGTQGNEGSDAPASDIFKDDVDDSPVIDLQETAEEAIKELEDTGAFVPGAVSYAKPRKLEVPDRYAGFKAQIGGEIAHLQRRLAALFETRKRCRSVVADEGRLDSRRIHLALAGSQAVYRRTEVKKVPKPVVSFALDCSSSMEGREIALALQAVIALVEVCDRMAIPTEIVVFSGEVGVVKTFDEPLARSRGVLGGIYANGGTPADAGLWEAATRLVQRREDRKILFVVTDGYPNDYAATIEVGQMIEASGVELYGIGIGIGSDSVKGFCSKSEVLTDSSGIAAAVLTALEARMF